MGGAARVAAAFLVVMASAIPANAANGTFSDVPESEGFHADIRWLDDSGITKGCDPPGNDRFCPDDPVTRGQMAAFLVRALHLTDTGTADFVDDDDSVFEADIERLAHARITLGCNPPTNNRFCPDDPVTRGQMAAFLRRAFQTVPETALSLVRSWSTNDYPSLDPSGLVYVESIGRLMVFDSAADELPGFDGINAFEIRLDGTLVRSWSTIGFSVEPAGATYDPGSGHILISDDDIGEVFELDPGLDGVFGSGDDAVSSFSTAVFGSHDPEGIAFDPATGDLFIANGRDSDDAELFWLSPGRNGVLDGVGPVGDDDVTFIDVHSIGIINPEGIVFDPLRRTLLIADRSQPGKVFETTRDGFLVRILTLDSAVTTDLAGLELAPSSTDPNVTSLYVADRGIEGVADGAIHEFRLR
jgi:hypothetical protein